MRFGPLLTVSEVFDIVELLGVGLALSFVIVMAQDKFASSSKWPLRILWSFVLLVALMLLLERLN